MEKQRFRMRNLIIHAEQWFPDKNISDVYTIKGSQDDLSDVLAEAIKRKIDPKTFWNACGYMKTALGPKLVAPGDWIVEHIYGSRLPFTPEEMKLYFEPIPDYEAALKPIQQYVDKLQDLKDSDMASIYQEEELARLTTLLDIINDYKRLYDPDLSNTILHELKALDGNRRADGYNEQGNGAEEVEREARMKNGR